MTEQALEARVQGLRTGLAELRANAAATEGALKEAEYWLAEMRKAKALANGAASMPEAIEKRITEQPAQ